MSTPVSDGSVGVVLVAAGSGVRLGSDGPKALTALAGRPLIAHALDGLAAASLPAPVVVFTPGEREAFEAAIGDRAVEALVPGGADRTASVRAGVDALPSDCDVVAVHDAARPLMPASVVRAAVDALTTGVVAAAPAIAVADTLKRTRDGEVVETIDRTGVVAVQTPQVFPRQVLEAALVAADGATDDLSLVERLVASGSLTGRIVTVPGSLRGLKVTYQEDLELAAALVGGART
jgi:2-C-methyl-D-erythritol 4-phosphate cytidylyltransferase